MIAFMIWVLIGIAFIGIGIYSFFAEKQVGFWANAKTFSVKDIKLYNKAVGKLWIAFGIIFALLGIPLLAGQNSPFIFISVLGVMGEVIGIMIVYTTVIEKKWRK